MTKEPISKPLTLGASSELLQVKVQFPQIEQFNQLFEWLIVLEKDMLLNSYQKTVTTAYHSKELPCFSS
jgi:hypothetical protein